MKKLLPALIAILPVIMFSSKSLSAQETEQKQIIKSLIDAQRYSFIAQIAVRLACREGS